MMNSPQSKQGKNLVVDDLKIIETAGYIKPAVGVVTGSKKSDTRNSGDNQKLTIASKAVKAPVSKDVNKICKEDDTAAQTDRCQCRPGCTFKAKTAYGQIRHLARRFEWETPEDKLEYYKQYNARHKDRRRQQQVERLAAPKGVLQRIYQTQCTHSRKRGHNPPAYSLEMLLARYLDDPAFLELYAAWLESGQDRLLKPSLDRINDSLGYSFDNIRLTTWQANHRKHCEDIKKLVEVFQDGKKICEYDSIMAASKAFKFGRNHIAKVIKTGTPIKGFVLRFAQ